MKKTYLIYFTLLFSPLLVGCSSNSTQQNQEVVNEESVEVVEQPKEIVKKEAKDLKIVRSDKTRIAYRNDGTSAKEEYDIIYKIVDKSTENSRIKTQVDQHLVFEEFNQLLLTEEIMKEVLFNAYELAKEEYPQDNAYFQIVIYPDVETANKKAGKWLALLNHINDEGVTIKYDYDKMNAFATKNNPSANFFNEDGSHKGLKAHILKTMYAPKTFEHIKTTYTDNKDYLIVTMKFRATNKKGENKEFIVVAQTDSEGNVKNLNEVK